MNYYQGRSSATAKGYVIKGYEYGEDYIVIYFTNNEQYIYTLGSCGIAHIKAMKSLADKQSGLNTYLTTHKPAYALLGNLQQGSVRYSSVMHGV